MALPAVVADVGSCVTVDYVDRDGVVVGGAIAPGLPLMKAVQAATTARIVVDNALDDEHEDALGFPAPKIGARLYLSRTF